jgi:hypothetical protein
MTDETPPKDPSAIVIPFGKHKGKTVAELLVTDQPYVDWVMGQGWVAERFAELHAALLNRGAAPDDTPDHNALQARFLDVGFRDAFTRRAADEHLTRALWRASMFRFLSKAEKDGRLSYLNSWAFRQLHDDDEKLKFLGATRQDVLQIGLTLHSAVFFEEKGVDVVITIAHAAPGEQPYLALGGSGYEFFKVELKPAMGDDYPSVMRQMKRLGAHFLVVGVWTGRGVTEPQMRAMFQASGINVVFVQEIEEQMRLASEPRP